MTRYEVLEALSTLGQDRNDMYDPELFGYFGWSLSFQGGDSVLTARFESENGESFEYEWVLNRKGGF